MSKVFLLASTGKTAVFCEFTHPKPEEHPPTGAAHPGGPDSSSRKRSAFPEFSLSAP